jgi:hypothetical protein
MGRGVAPPPDMVLNEIPRFFRRKSASRINESFSFEPPDIFLFFFVEVFFFVETFFFVEVFFLRVVRFFFPPTLA